MTTTVMVVMMPMKRLTQASNTKATLGTLKTKLAGYISGMVANLKYRKYIAFCTLP